jgi:ABC-2 family transporter protein
MIWLTWRQHRVEALIIACALVVAVAVFVAFGVEATSAFGLLGLDRCSNPSTRACGAASAAFVNEFGQLPAYAALGLVLVPVLLGMFIGAPLVAREIDRGTHRLAWSQSVSRARWLLFASAGVLLLGASAVAVLAVSVNWAFETYLGLAGTSPFQYWLFDVLGIVPVAYTVFAIALGIAAGSLLPRTLPAMLVVLVAFAVVRISIDAVARPRYMPPLTAVQTIGAGHVSPAPTGAFVVNTVLHDLRGRPCVNGAPCEVGSLVVTYQPADRYWRFQEIEFAIYLGLSLPLLGLTAYWVRRRVT